MFNAMLTEHPSVAVKRRHLSTVMEYCLDNKIAFRVLPRTGPDEWEVQFDVTEILPAVALGMFLRDHKLELTGYGPVITKPASVTRSKSKKSQHEEEQNVSQQPTAEPQFFEKMGNQQAGIQETQVNQDVQDAPETSHVAQAEAQPFSADEAEDDAHMEQQPSAEVDQEIEPMEAPFSLPGLGNNSPGMF